MDSRVLLVGAPEVLTASQGAEREQPPSPVKSINEIAADRELRGRQVMRHYSLMSWLSKNGLIHRTNPGRCGCGRPISANKTHCAGCAPKE